MIFATVGNARQGFARFLDAVDRSAEGWSKSGEEVFVQTGHNPGFAPRYCAYRPFVEMDEFQRWLEVADVIVSHGGCGTLLQAIWLGHAPVAMPRRKTHGEHVNDHQVQLVRALAADGLVVPVDEPGALGAAVEEARRRGRSRRTREPARMAGLIAAAIDELAGDRLHPQGRPSVEPL